MCFVVSERAFHVLKSNFDMLDAYWWLIVFGGFSFENMEKAIFPGGSAGLGKQYLGTICLSSNLN